MIVHALPPSLEMSRLGLLLCQHSLLVRGYQLRQCAVTAGFRALSRDTQTPSAGGMLSLPDQFEFSPGYTSLRYHSMLLHFSIYGLSLIESFAELSHRGSSTEYGTLPVNLAWYTISLYFWVNQCSATAITFLSNCPCTHTIRGRDHHALKSCHNVEPHILSRAAWRTFPASTPAMTVQYLYPKGFRFVSKPPNLRKFGTDGLDSWACRAFNLVSWPSPRFPE